MHVLFVALRLYPYWACPSIFVLIEVGIFFRRKRHPIQYGIWIGILSLIIGLALWIFYRGDINSDRWLKAMILN